MNKYWFLLFGLLFATSCGVLNTPSPSSSSNTYTDIYAGFSISQPTGYDVVSSSGVIIVKQDSQGITGALVYPTSLEADITAEAFLRDYFALYSNISGSTSLTLETVTAANSDYASASFSGTVSNTQVKGVITASRESTASRLYAIYRAYWAPTSDFDSKKDELKAIADSYYKLPIKDISPLIYQSDPTNAIKMAGPDGWTFTAEVSTVTVINIPPVINTTTTSISVSIYDPSSKDSGYIGVMEWVGPYTNRPADPKILYDDIKALVTTYFTDIASWEDSSEYQYLNDNNILEGGYIKCKIKYKNGSEVSAYVYTNVLIQLSSYQSGVLSIKQAPESQLNSKIGLLTRIEKSIIVNNKLVNKLSPFIKINIPTYDFSSSAKYNSEVREKTANKWSEVILEYEPMQGQGNYSDKMYDMPWSAWDDTNKTYWNPELVKLFPDRPDQWQQLIKPADIQ